MDFNKDYYKILEVEVNAEMDIIKASYRRLAKKFHPDKNGGSNGSDESFKLINEAYQVLGNSVRRDVYDKYHRYATQLRQKERKQKFSSGNFTISKKEVLKKKKIRIYFKGELITKYWAEQIGDSSLYGFQDVEYKINPTDTEITINGRDFFLEHELSANYQMAFAAARPLMVSLKRPFKCNIKYDNKEEFYEFDIPEILYGEAEILNITRFENECLGTLRAEVYGYIIKINEEIEIEEEIIFSGETGKYERSTRDKADFVKKEYYNVDGTTFWSDWEKQSVPSTKEKATNQLFSDDIDLSWILSVIVVLILVAVLPWFFLPILAIIACGYLLSFLLSYLSNIPFRAILFVLIPVYFLLRHGLFSFSSVPVVKVESGFDSLHARSDTVMVREGDHLTIDQEITHFIKWKDYRGRQFSGSFSVLQSNVRRSAEFHANLNLPIRTESDVSQIYRSLNDSDSKYMTKIYSEFERIRNNNSLNEHDFANMVVSCIQVIPYALILDGDCNPSLYGSDIFIQQFLRKCKDSCCVGYVKYGVNSPVEFWKNLKGDCDTRSLLLYNILKHFNYNVALMVSNYYKHSIIAVGFTEGNNEGLVFNVNGQNYSCWETTNKGFEAGAINNDYSNLKYWNIALINFKQKNMNNSLTGSIVIPTFFTMIQSLIFVIAAQFFLRRLKLLQLAYTDIGKALTVGAVLFGVLLISASSVGAIYRTYIINGGEKSYTFSTVFDRFSQYFFICLCAEILFVTIVWILSKLIIKETQSSEKESGLHLASTVSFLFVACGIAIVCFLLSQAVCELIVPITINFN